MSDEKGYCKWYVMIWYGLAQLFFDWIHPIQCSLIDQKEKKSGVHDFRHVALLKRLNWLNSGRHRLLTFSFWCIYLSLLKESSLLIRIYLHFEIDPSNLLLILPIDQVIGPDLSVAEIVLWILTSCQSHSNRYSYSHCCMMVSLCS